jgi:hypothetical protein
MEHMPQKFLFAFAAFCFVFEPMSLFPLSYTDNESLLANQASPVGTTSRSGTEHFSMSSVTIYDRGEITRLPADRDESQLLITLAEDRLRSANNVLRLAVTPGLIAGIQRSELAVEIGYAQPQTFAIFGKKEIKPKQLLLPLTGDFAEGVTTIFVGYPQYAAGPYRARGAPDRLRELVNRLQSER